MSNTRLRASHASYFLILATTYKGGIIIIPMFRMSQEETKVQGGKMTY